ncbi:MAG: GntR family transcriptional regulator [Anaerolineaceae bacterium]
MIKRNNDSKSTLEKKLPKYRQIEEDLKYRILLGEWKPGDRILSEEEFCKVYNVSRITVKKAISELELAGYLYQISGKGTFVKNFQEETQENTFIKSFTNEMRERGMNAITTSVILNLVPADQSLAGLLNVNPGSQIFQLQRVRAVSDGDIIAYSVNSFPNTKPFSTDAKDYYNSFYDYLATFGILLISAKEYLEAMLPPTHVAEMLQIQQSEPVLKFVRVSHNSDYNFSEHNLCYYIGSKYRYYVNA